MRNNHSKKSYDLLPQDEAQEHLETRKASRQYSTMSVILFMIFEALVLVTIFASYTYWRSFQPLSRNDEYFSLGVYNTTKDFDLGIEYMEDYPEADKFWLDIIDNNGVVSVPAAWAEAAGFEQSRAHPEIPDHSIYQVDAFHAIHCLYRIRTRLLSKQTWDVHGEHESEDNVNADVALGHTLHCINYIRQSLMCNADITLQATGNFRAFIKNGGHQCRDFDSIALWAKRQSWVGHMAWLTSHVDELGH